MNWSSKNLAGWLTLFFGLVLFCNSIHVYGTATTENKPTAQIQVRYPDYQKLKAFRENSEFQYVLDAPPPPTASFWKRLWYKITKWLRKLGRAKSYNNSGKYLMYAFTIGVAIFVILQLFRVNFVGLFGRKPAAIPIPYETYGENIHEINFDALIEEATSQGDYRRAIRLHYLSVLKSLTDKAIIDWKPAKTNRSYVVEIKNNQLRQSFENITHLFEYVWYGGSGLSEAGFETMRHTFREFNQNVKLRA